jgi:hypothetical protein
MPNDKTPDAHPCPKCGSGMRPQSRTPGGKTRWECRRYESGRQIFCYSTTNPGSGIRSQNGDVAPATRPKVFRRKLRDTKVFIITSAQNATPVHEVFWGCLQTMATWRRAEIMVIPIRYKNPTSVWEDSQANAEHWAAEVTPYLWNTRKALNQNLVLLGDVKIQPTASSPLTGFDSLSGSSSAIVGHTKLQLRCIATPNNRMAKIMTTTGACTKPNYTDSRAGKLGNFHHTLAAVVVEVVGKKFFLRQLNFDTKTQSFTDLDTRYYEDRAEKAPRAAALIMGDTHTDFISKAVEKATFGKKGMVESLRPEYLIWHDLLDGYAVNPHHKGNPFNAIAKVASGRAAIKAEVERACHYVKNHTPPATRSVIVPSNHDDFLRRWIVNADWKQEPGNALFYLKTAASMVEKTRFVERYGTWYPSPFPMIFRQTVDCSNIELLESDPECPEKSFVIEGIELSMHGERGPNGSRGSIQNHKRLGVRSIIGHAHTPGIEEGCYQVGTSTNLRLEYTSGPSSWLNAHCAINADGRRQLIVIVDGKWRA